jgi:hypothetical protein
MRRISMPDAKPTIIVTGLQHDFVNKRSNVSLLWSDQSQKHLALPVPYLCAFESVRAEAEKAVRELAAEIAAIEIRSAD